MIGLVYGECLKDGIMSVLTLVNYYRDGNTSAMNLRTLTGIMAILSVYGGVCGIHTPTLIFYYCIVMDPFDTSRIRSDFMCFAKFHKCFHPIS